MKPRSLIASLALGAALLWSQSALASVVLFDDFNADTQTLNFTGDALFTSTSPPGSVDLIGAGGAFDFYPGHGNYVDLDGTTGTGNDPAGQLTSNSSFAAGSYTLSFLLGGNARNAPAQTTVVTLGDFTQSFTLSSNDPLALRTVSFTTSGGNLIFSETGPSDQQGNILDDVKLTTGVPELSTWGMMLIGFAGLSFVGSRRRSRARVSKLA